MATTGLGDIGQFIRDIERLPGSFQSIMKKELQWLLRTTLKQVRDNSPVDTETFRRRWSPLIMRSGGITTGIVSNDLDYGRWIELGSEKGKKPWPRPGKKTTFGPGGRIFSTQAVGGVINPMFSDGWVEQHVTEFIERVVGRWLSAI